MSDLAISLCPLLDSWLRQCMYGSGGNLEGSLYIQSHACCSETHTGDMDDSVFCVLCNYERLYC